MLPMEVSLLVKLENKEHHLEAALLRLWLGTRYTTVPPKQFTCLILTIVEVRTETKRVRITTWGPERSGLSHTPGQQAGNRGGQG